MTLKWNAQEYAKHSSVQSNWARAVIDRVDPKKGEFVLDVGCGTGANSQKIAQLAFPGKVVGIDSSPKMIEKARHDFAQVSNLSFQCMPVEKMEFSSEFDAVFSNAALHWVKDRGLALKNIFKALKPGGRFIAQFGGHGNVSNLVHVLEELQKSPLFARHYENWKFPWVFNSPQTYEKLLSKAGFKKISANLEDKPTEFDWAGLKGWVETTCFPYHEHLPQNLKEKFFETLKNSTVLQNSNGNYVINFKRLNISAFKPY